MAKQFANNHFTLIDFLQRQGLSLHAIARALNARQAPTLRGRTWQAAQIKNILARPAPIQKDNPFYIVGPAVVSFSGGRTSGFLLKKIIDAHHGKLPDNIKIVYANTGKERPETLDFIQACSEKWDVVITWLEYDPDAKHNTRIVNYNTAARHGQPFQAIIQKKQFLPNPVMRFCTAELKVKPIQSFAQYGCQFKAWHNVIGIRFDEPRRVEKIQTRCSGCVTLCSRAGPQSKLPLHQTRFIEDDILSWWQTQDFNLALQPHEGNCDLCFLKGNKKLSNIMKNRPDLARWWIAQESQPLGKEILPRTFRKNLSYSDMLNNLHLQIDDTANAENDDCACTD